MKYLKFLTENTIKNLIEEKLHLQVEKVEKNEKTCFITLKSNSYDLNLKFEINDFEAKCLNESFKTKLTKEITKIIQEIFTKFFKEKYLKDLKDYLSTKENKFIKNLRNLDIEQIFAGFKILSIKRLNSAIEVVATNNLNKEFLSCYITNFKVINTNPKLYKKEMRKIEKNFLSFMVSTYGQKYMQAFLINENKNEDMKKC